MIAFPWSRLGCGRSGNYWLEDAIRGSLAMLYFPAPKYSDVVRVRLGAPASIRGVSFELGRGGSGCSRQGTFLMLPTVLRGGLGDKVLRLDIGEDS